MLKEWRTFDELMLKTLSSPDDIKERLSAGLEEYIENDGINAFARPLEYAVKAQDNISNISKKTGISRSNLYSIFKGEVTPRLNTIVKILKELGYTLKIA